MIMWFLYICGGWLIVSIACALIIGPLAIRCIKERDDQLPADFWEVERE